MKPFIPLLLVALIIRCSPACAEDLSAGFLFDHFKLTLEDGYRTEAAGPFYYSQQADSGTVWAVPPFCSSAQNPDIEWSEFDVFYPLFSKLHYGHEKRWQFFEIINSASGVGPDGTEPKRFTLFPIYFQQRAADTNLNYTAVFPFYGQLKNRLFRDQIDFVMFPAYVQTRKRDVVIDNYFFPFVDVRHGNGMRGWQVWPFVGHSHKTVTTQTNGYGDVITVPGYDHSFCVWPFYSSQDNGIGSQDPETIRALIPFYVLTRSPEYDSTSIFWPFFASIDNRARKYHEWQGPWPFVIFARGEGKYTSRVWPIFSQSHDAIKENDSYLWPIYVYSRVHSDPLDRTRSRILFYLYSRVDVKNTETGKDQIRVDMWPFFTWHHEYDGNTRLQILAPLEPAVPDNPGIERNWSPLWSLWRSENNPARHASNQSLLWNLYHRQVQPGEKTISCLFGLCQYHSSPQGNSLRLLYIPVTHSHKR